MGALLSELIVSLCLGFCTAGFVHVGYKSAEKKTQTLSNVRLPISSDYYVDCSFYCTSGIRHGEPPRVGFVKSAGQCEDKVARNRFAEIAPAALPGHGGQEGNGISETRSRNLALGLSFMTVTTGRPW